MRMRKTLCLVVGVLLCWMVSALPYAASQPARRENIQMYNYWARKNQELNEEFRRIVVKLTTTQDANMRKALEDRRSRIEKILVQLRRKMGEASQSGFSRDSEAVKQGKLDLATKMGRWVVARRKQKDVRDVERGVARRDVLTQYVADDRGRLQITDVFAETMLRTIKTSSEYQMFFFDLLGHDWDTPYHQERVHKIGGALFSDVGVIKKILGKMVSSYTEAHYEKHMLFVRENVSRLLEAFNEDQSRTREQEEEYQQLLVRGFSEWSQELNIPKEKDDLFHVYEQWKKDSIEWDRTAHEYAQATLNGRLRSLWRLYLSMRARLVVLQVAPVDFSYPDRADVARRDYLIDKEVLSVLVGILYYLMEYVFDFTNPQPRPLERDLQRVICKTFTQLREVGHIPLQVPFGEDKSLQIYKGGWLSGSTVVTERDTDLRRVYEARMLTVAGGLDLYGLDLSPLFSDALMEKLYPGFTTDTAKSLFDRVIVLQKRMNKVVWGMNGDVGQLLVDLQQEHNRLSDELKKMVKIENGQRLQDVASMKYRELVRGVVFWNENKPISFANVPPYTSLLDSNVDRDQAYQAGYRLYVLCLWKSFGNKIKSFFTEHAEEIMRRTVNKVRQRLEHSGRRLTRGAVAVQGASNHGRKTGGFVGELQEGVNSMTQTVQGVIEELSTRGAGLPTQMRHDLADGDFSAAVERVSLFLESTRKQLPRLSELVEMLQEQTRRTHAYLRRELDEKFGQSMRVIGSLSTYISLVSKQVSSRLESTQGFLDSLKDNILARGATWLATRYGPARDAIRGSSAEASSSAPDNDSLKMQMALEEMKRALRGEPSLTTPSGTAVGTNDESSGGEGDVVSASGRVV